ncbi:hypothetical protein D3C86_1838460 [compost metagenome]
MVLSIQRLKVIDDCESIGCYYNIQIQQMLFKQLPKGGEGHVGFTTIDNDGAPTFFRCYSRTPVGSQL